MRTMLTVEAITDLPLLDPFIRKGDVLEGWIDRCAYTGLLRIAFPDPYHSDYPMIFHLDYFRLQWRLPFSISSSFNRHTGRFTISLNQIRDANGNLYPLCSGYGDDRLYDNMHDLYARLPRRRMAEIVKRGNVWPTDLYIWDSLFADLDAMQNGKSID